MEAGDKIVECVVTVQRLSPNDHIDTYILGGALLLVVLVIALAVVLYHWADVRDKERDQEILTLRRITRANGMTGVL